MAIHGLILRTQCNSFIDIRPSIRGVHNIIWLGCKMMHTKEMHVHVVMSSYVLCLPSLIKKGMLVILNNDNYVDMHTKLQVSDSICWLKIT